MATTDPTWETWTAGIARLRKKAADLAEVLRELFEVPNGAVTDEQLDAAAELHRLTAEIHLLEQLVAGGFPDGPVVT